MRNNVLLKYVLIVSVVLSTPPAYAGCADWLAYLWKGLSGNRVSTRQASQGDLENSSLEALPAKTAERKSPSGEWEKGKKAEDERWLSEHFPTYAFYERLEVERQTSPSEPKVRFTDDKYAVDYLILREELDPKLREAALRRIPQDKILHHLEESSSAHRVAEGVGTMQDFWNIINHGSISFFGTNFWNVPDRTSILTEFLIKAAREDTGANSFLGEKTPFIIIREGNRT